MSKPYQGENGNWTQDEDGNWTYPTTKELPPLRGKPTPVRDARTNVKNERSQLADARQQLMVAKETRAKQMAEKAAKQAANKPPPVLPTPKPPPMRPTTPMPDRPMPMPPPMSGGPTGNIFKTIQDAVRSGATQGIPKAVQGAVNKMPTSSGGVMGGVTNAVQSAVNKMPMPPNFKPGMGAPNTNTPMPDSMSVVPEANMPPAPTTGIQMRKGGAVRNKSQTKFASGGSVNSASRRGDGIAQRGKTKGRYL